MISLQNLNNLHSQSESNGIIEQYMAYQINKGVNNSNSLRLTDPYEEKTNPPKLNRFADQDFMKTINRLGENNSDMAEQQMRVGGPESHSNLTSRKALSEEGRSNQQQFEN